MILFFACYFLFLIYNEDVNGYERKIIINNILKTEGRIQINELAERLEVTKVTVRSDLDDLEKRGLLVRTHGGAILAENHQLGRLNQTLLIDNIALFMLIFQVFTDHI